MRIINISIEIPDAQYLALERRAARLNCADRGWTVEKEITYLAEAAVTLTANEELKKEETAIRNAQIIDDFIVDDVPIRVIAAQKEQTPTDSDDPEGEPGAEDAEMDLSHTGDAQPHTDDEEVADAAVNHPTSAELDLFLRCVHAETEGQDLDCKTATAEVIINRLHDPRFPDTITEVILQPGQFTVVSNGKIDKVMPDMSTITAVENAVNGSRTIPDDYIYFDCRPIGSDVIQIGGHYFGR